MPISTDARIAFVGAAALLLFTTVCTTDDGGSDSSGATTTGPTGAGGSDGGDGDGASGSGGSTSGTSGSGDGDPSGGTSGGSDTGTGGDTDATTDTGASGNECTDPVFETSEPNGGWTDGGYYVHNNMWNSPCCQTLYACAYDNWYVVSNQIDEAGAVKTYPNVHKDYDAVSISSFSTITSTFAATTPHVGIYNVAYDIWLNGIASPGCTEVMIWTENFDQVPAGSMVETVTLGGWTYDVWRASWDWEYVAFVPDTPRTSGSIDLLEIFNWMISRGWIPPDSTVSQIDYGIEIVSTDGNDETFTVTDFSITDN
jgi:hypothetical protein